MKAYGINGHGLFYLDKLIGENPIMNITCSSNGLGTVNATPLTGTRGTSSTIECVPNNKCFLYSLEVEGDGVFNNNTYKFNTTDATAKGTFLSADLTTYKVVIISNYQNSTLKNLNYKPTSAMVENSKGTSALTNEQLNAMTGSTGYPIEPYDCTLSMYYSDFHSPINYKLYSPQGWGEASSYYYAVYTNQETGLSNEEKMSSKVAQFQWNVNTVNVSLTGTK